MKNKAKKNQKKADWSRGLSKTFTLKTLEDKTEVLRFVPGVVYVGKASGGSGTLWMSDKVKEMTGFTPVNFIKKDKFWMERMHPEDKDRVRHDFLKTLFDKGSVITEYRWLHKDGKYRWFLDQAILIKDKKGQPQEIMGTWRDITQKKVDEEKVRQGEMTFHKLTEAIPQIVWSKDAKDVTRYYNNQWSEYTGYTLDDNPGSKEWMHPDDYSHYLKVWNESKKTGKPFELEYRLRRKDGVYRWFLGRAVPLKDGDGKTIMWIGTATDIEDQKETERLIGHRERYYRALIENSSDIIFLVCDGNKISYVSPSVKKLLGFSAANINKKNLYDFVNPEDRRAVEVSIKNQKNQGLSIAQFRLKRKDGTWRWIEGVVHNLEKDPNVAGVVINARDITDRMELEKRKDDFISMASHELKTPVTSLKLYTEILEREAKESKQTGTASYLSKMSQQIDTLTGLINELLDLSRIQAEKFEIRPGPFDIYELLRDDIQNIQMISPRHRIKLTGQKGIIVSGDRERIRQVIVNLLMNSIKYSPDSPNVDVELSVENNNAKIAVQDYGIGIRPEQQKKIFDRFYQIQEPHQKPFSGLGVGLYISKNIILKHGGDLWVKSEHGNGSVFTFTIPLDKNTQTKFQADRTDKTTKNTTI